MRGRRAIAGLASLVVAAGVLAAVVPVSAGADTPSQQFPPVDQPGVTQTEINVGGVVSKTNPLGGDYASSLDGVQAYFNMVNAAGQATVVHSHTWYTGLAGHLTALLNGIPHVLTAHSLEPMRPWKAEQLGGGYRVSSWVEETASRRASKARRKSFGSALVRKVWAAIAWTVARVFFTR